MELFEKQKRFCTYTGKENGYPLIPIKASIMKHTYTYFKSLEGILPLARKVLRVSADDFNLKIFHATSHTHFNLQYMYEKGTMDEIIDMYGFGDLPPVIYSGMHGWAAGKCPGYGLVHCRTKTGIDYLIVNLNYDATVGGFEHFFITRRKDFKSFLYYLKSIKREKNILPPILEPTLFDMLKRNTLEFLSRGRDLKKYGVKPYRGILLVGKPGNGKSMFCKWLKQICKLNKYSYNIITGSKMKKTVVNGWELGANFKSQINFFDDIDISFFLDRSSPRSDTTMAGELLTAMDGLQTYDCSVRIFTTNEDVENIDSAFKRPGRLDIVVKFDLPTEELRRRLIVERWGDEINQHLANRLDELVEKTEGMSFAEVEAIKTAMVLNKFSNGVWDLDKALVDNSLDGFKEKERLGF